MHIQKHYLKNKLIRMCARAHTHTKFIHFMSILINFAIFAVPISFVHPTYANMKCFIKLVSWEYMLQILCTCTIL